MEAKEEADLLFNVGLTAGSLIASFVIAYMFYLLQKRHAQSASLERALRAKAELVEVLEQHVVSRKLLKSGTIRTLIQASEREHKISLHDICSPVSLLQDVSFRLQRSSHLDVQQKTEFQDMIDTQLNELSSRRSAAVLFPSLQELKTLAVRGDQEGVRRLIAEIEKVGEVQEGETLEFVEFATGEGVGGFALISLIGTMALFIALLPHYAPKESATQAEQFIFFALMFASSMAASFPVSFVARWWNKKNRRNRTASEAPNQSVAADDLHRR